MLVYVYRNLRNKCWSIRSKEGITKGLVILHCHEIDVSNVVFTVSESSRQRVIRDNQKNVHAGVTGRLIGVDNVVDVRYDISYRSGVLPHEGSTDMLVKYDPYKYPYFFLSNRQDRPITTARRAFFRYNGRVTVIGAD